MLKYLLLHIRPDDYTYVVGEYVVLDEALERSDYLQRFDTIGRYVVIEIKKIYRRERLY